MIDDYQKLIFSICYKITADYFIAEDLAQETFVAAYQNLPRLSQVNEKAYLARIAANKSIDYLRNAASRQIPTAETFFRTQIDHGSQPEEVYLQTEIKTMLRQCIAKLKPPYAEIAAAYYIEEKTPKEIAFAQKANLKTIQTQIYRAREMLKEAYGKEMP